MNFGSQRPTIVQQVISYGLAVSGVTPTPIGVIQNLDKTRLITTFVVSNPIAGSSVYMGNSGVSATGANQGLEIQAGTAPAFVSFQEGRQIYEMQTLVAMIAQQLKCTPPELEKIPFICWDLTQIFLISGNAAGSQVTIGAFPQMYL